MLKVRERNNQWPGFVDLFSNLVIVLIFLLIVFVFLWTTTNVFNKTSAIAKVSELNKVNAAQTQEINSLKQNEVQAKDLLIAARDQLINLDNTRTTLENQKSALENEKNKLSEDQLDMVAAYEKKIYDLSNDNQNMTNAINSLQAQVGNLSNQQNQNAMTAQEQMQRAANLQAEIERMNTALSAAEQARSQKEVEYAALSTRFNQAMSDKVAELTQLNKYQSQFIGAIRDALGGMQGVDVSSDRFVISSDILFPLGGFNLSPEGKNQIRIIANIIQNMESKIPSNIKWVIRVDGHTDRLPVLKNAKLYKTNLELSLLRAKEVATELKQNGISDRRLVPAGFGETQPIVEGKDAKALAKNRRIELRLTNP